MTKYIFISGGVVSGLGKGITTASLSLLLKSVGLKVSPMKIDMYLNIDAGTIRPQEHGEVFVTDDGMESDEDLGHYERFLNESLTKDNYTTTGQIYQEVIRKERAFEYKGEDVEAIPHLTDEISRRIRLAGESRKADVVLIELGGTVGEYQNGIFFEAYRIMKLQNPKDVFHIHVAYLPYLASLGELKSKPVQTSVHILNSLGIQPDFIFTRSEKPVDKKRRERLALFCNVQDLDIFDNPDMECVYNVPLNLEKQEFTKRLLEKMGVAVGDLGDLPAGRQEVRDLGKWKERIENLENAKTEIKIGIVGKYFTTGEYTLADSYVSVVEALRHAGAYLGIKPKIVWIDTEKIEREGCAVLEGLGGVIVPQGWGNRGIEGKISAIKYCREKKIPYFGLCFGMQMAVIEFARNVVGLKDANTGEAQSKTSNEVIHIMPEQEKYLAKKQYGGTIRLGSWPCVLTEDSKILEIYQKYEDKHQAPSTKFQINERHRHRYEFNNEYREVLEKNGLVISGVSPDGKLVEAIELKDHPFFIGTQFHPEYKSRLLCPHPLFIGFLRACKKKS